MTVPNSVIWLVWILTILALLVFVYRETKKPRDTVYRVRVKFHQNVKTKLVLNSTQWEQFQAWLNNPDGIYEIGDDANLAWLDRRHVVSVEMKKR